MDNETVRVRSAGKHFGPSDGPKRKDVLVNFDMTVRKKNIYSLLGASGCGKTTLLNCIVGLQKIDSGDICVLGGTPGSSESGVPGPRIGYMPQETALIGEFTVKESIYYFGRLYGMSEKKIEERFTFLSKSLNFPPDSRYIRNCSGGEQRRISFSIALVHEPELVILDEPTVGLDPMLREKIWIYLKEISVNCNTSVIITTHYLAEAVNCDVVGLMRNGSLLVEDDPQYLLRVFSMERLDDVFVHLSEKQTKGELVEEFQSEEYRERKRKLEPNTFAIENSIKTNKNKKQRIEVYHLKSLVHKSLMQTLRHPCGIGVSLLFPFFTLFSVYVAFNSDPMNIKVGFVNEEANWTDCTDFTQPTFYNENSNICEFDLLSCKFINALNDSLIQKEFYPNTESALQAVRKGRLTAVIYFKHNYTDAFNKKFNDVGFTTDDNAQINVWMDMTSGFAEYFQRKMYEKHNKFSEILMKDCNREPRLSQIPIRFEQPIYGKFPRSISLRHEMTPGIMISCAFFMSAMLTSTLLIDDRLNGVWNRTLVAGATYFEMFLAHAITNFVVMLLEIIETLIIVFAIIGDDCVGNIIYIGLLLLMQGLNGMAYGFLISVFSTSSVVCVLWTLGSFYPVILLSGLLWPLEGMPYYLEIIAKCTFFATPIRAVKNVTEKGWSITNLHVADGIMVPVIWFILSVVLCSIKLLK